MKTAILIIITVTLMIVASACGETNPKEEFVLSSTLEYQNLDTYDVRSLMWGMTIEQIVAQEQGIEIVETIDGDFIAKNVSFADYSWRIKYDVDDNGLYRLTYICNDEDVSSSVFWHIDLYFYDLYGYGVTNDVSSEIRKELWRTDSCDIELCVDTASSPGTASITFVPRGRFEAKFDNYKTQNPVSQEDSSTKFKYTVPHGKVLDVNETGDILIIKTKISPSFNNHATISQNFQNLEDLIVNQGCSKYSEIQYWAVADMTDGSESKVVSFTAPESTINGIKDGSINVISYLDEYGYLEDVYILPSLKD